MKKTFQYRAKVSCLVESRLNDWLLKCREFYKVALENIALINGSATAKDWDEGGKKLNQLIIMAKEQKEIAYEVIWEEMNRKVSLIEYCYKKKYLQ